VFIGIDLLRSHRDRQGLGFAPRQHAAREQQISGPSCHSQRAPVRSRALRSKVVSCEP